MRNRLSLGAKLAILSVVVTATVVAVTFLALRARARADVRHAFVAELEASQRGLQQLQDRDLRMLLATSAVVSTSPTLRAALQTSRIESNAGLPARRDLQATIQREAQRVFTDLDRDILVVTDESGRVLATVGRGSAALPRSGTILQLPALRYALASDNPAPDSGFGVLIAGEPPVPYQVGCVAIILDGYPIGALVLGERVERLMSRFAAPGTHAAVMLGDSVILGSRSSDMASKDYVTASVSLGLAADGKPATLHLARSVGAALSPITASLGRSFLFAGIAALLLIGGGAALASRTTLRPLSSFVEFLRAGKFETFHHTDGTPPAEIATLTEAYNGLVESLRESEEQLRQSQKLEALGTLAGGVAHDFNNLLSVIMGFAQISQQNASNDATLQADLAQISEAADRAAVLVKQLLAFGRKQVMQPQIVDLNHIVTRMEAMLERLIGEDLELQTNLEPRLARIKADPGQLEQVIMNLVVNARDALPNGGTISVETANVRLDERFERRPEAIAAGPAVMLAVSDDGIGMDEATRRRIFEPFFTTKPPGKGTGLGLSTVYGIVRQSGGSITVYSEPGNGTTFRCYFPPSAIETRQETLSAASDDGLNGDETVLVVEDDPQIRSLLHRCLTGRGYTVLAASHGPEAIDVADRHRGHIHLLLTDVVMPHMSGKELAERMQKLRPDVRVLFISGYSNEAIDRHGVLAEGSSFLQKPMQPDVLARTVRRILDGGAVA